jgi:hypothetical protein
MLQWWPITWEGAAAVAPRTPLSLVGFKWHTVLEPLRGTAAVRKPVRARQTIAPAPSIPARTGTTSTVPALLETRISYAVQNVWGDAADAVSADQVNSTKGDLASSRGQNSCYWLDEAP